MTRMKRMLTVFVVALVVAAMMVATAAPSFAKIRQETRNPQGKTTQASCKPKPQQCVALNPADKMPPGQQPENP